MMSAIGGTVTCWGTSFKFLGLRGVRAEVRFAEGPIAFSSDMLHRKQAAVEARRRSQALGAANTFGEAGQVVS